MTRVAARRAPGAAPGARVLLVDNYDSFTYNLAQLLATLGATVEVVRNDAFALADVDADLPDGIVISPGPGAPADAGLSNDVIRAFAGRTPLLGVCLGHQCIGEVFGGRVVRAPELVHGKTSSITHDGTGVFTGLADPFPATRYHSLVVEEASLPLGGALRVTARSTPAPGRPALVMGLAHRAAPVEGVQFHPESILTAVGRALLGNWVAALRRVPAAP